MDSSAERALPAASAWSRQNLAQRFLPVDILRDTLQFPSEVQHTEGSSSSMLRTRPGCVGLCFAYPPELFFLVD